MWCISYFVTAAFLPCNDSCAALTICFTTLMAARWISSKSLVSKTRCNTLSISTPRIWKRNVKCTNWIPYEKIGAKSTFYKRWQKTYLFGLKQNTYRKTDIIYRFSHAQKRRSIQVIQSLIMLTQDKQEIWFEFCNSVVSVSVYITWLSILSLNNLKLHKTKQWKNILYTRILYFYPAFTSTSPD